eukprot:scaffold98801_cov42-Phaeocystis_antarctica.AAC.1
MVSACLAAAAWVDGPPACNFMRGAAPEWSKAVDSTTLEATGYSTRGSGWASTGPGSRPGCLEPPGAARRALGRRRSRAGALPRGRFGPAAAP